MCFFVHALRGFKCECVRCKVESGKDEKVSEFESFVKVGEEGQDNDQPY